MGVLTRWSYMPIYVRVAVQGETPQRGYVEASSAQFATLVHKAKLKVAWL